MSEIVTSPNLNKEQHKVELELIDEIDAFEVGFSKEVISILFPERVEEISKEVINHLRAKFPGSAIKISVNPFNRFVLHVDNRWSDLQVNLFDEFRAE